MAASFRMLSSEAAAMDDDTQTGISGDFQRTRRVVVVLVQRVRPFTAAARWRHHCKWPDETGTVSSFAPDALGPRTPKRGLPLLGISTMRVSLFNGPKAARPEFAARRGKTMQKPPTLSFSAQSEPVHSPAVHPLDCAAFGLKRVLKLCLLVPQ